MKLNVVAALFLAQKAVVAVEIPSQRLGNVLAVAATATDPGQDACSTALNVIDYCYDEIDDFNDAPAATQAACLCCLSTDNLDSYYTSCAAYVSSNFPRSTDVYSVNTAVATLCARESNICASATDSALPTATASDLGGDDQLAAPCSSAAYIIASCTDANPGFATWDNAEAASCICYAGSKPTYTTAFDDYVESCADWASTADPEYYETFYELEGFCSYYTPDGGSGAASATTTSAAFPLPTADTTATATATARSSSSSSSGSSSSGSSSGSAGTTGSPTGTASASPTAAASSTTSPNPGSVVVPGGILAWVASVLSFLLSLGAMV